MANIVRSSLETLRIRGLLLKDDYLGDQGLGKISIKLKLKIALGVPSDEQRQAEVSWI